MVITVEDTIYGDNVTVNVSADVDGTYAIDINGTIVNVMVSGGKGANTTALNMNAGSYLADTSFVNENYTTVVSKANFNITREINNVVITVDDVTLPGNVTVKVTADVDGTYAVDINGTVVNVKVSNGNGENTTSFKAGHYLANTTFEDVNYEARITVDTFNVSNVSEYEMKASVNDTEITVTVPKDASGNVTAKIANPTYSAKIENGTAVIDASDIPEGNHTAEIIYEGDDKYAGKSTSSNIVKNHIPTVISDDLNRRYNSGMDFNATFKDAKGNPLANSTVTFKIGDKTYNVTTDSEGVARLNEKLAVGKYVVTSINPVTGENASNNLTITVRIANNNDLVMDYRDGSKFSVQLIGDDGKAAGAGETVVFKVNGREYNVKTNANGIASLPINLVPKTYTITSTYKDSSVKNKITVKQILKSKNVKVKRSAKKLTLKATLKWSNGKAIKGKKITFKFKGKTYTAKTNKKGVAKVVIKKKVIKKLKAGKKYKFKVKYIDDTITKKVTVRK